MLCRPTRTCVEAELRTYGTCPIGLRRTFPRGRGVACPKVGAAALPLPWRSWAPRPSARRGGSRRDQTAEFPTTMSEGHNTYRASRDEACARAERRPDNGRDAFPRKNPTASVKSRSRQT
jgi:hypothetical protein